METTLETLEKIRKDSPMSNRGRPFEPGNKLGKGRPPGSPNKMSLLLQKMLLDNGAEILSNIIEDAKKGDAAARKLIMDRLIPRLKPAVELPIVETDRTAISLDTPLFGNEYLRELEELESDLRKPPTVEEEGRWGDSRVTVS